MFSPASYSEMLVSLPTDLLDSEVYRLERENLKAENSLGIQPSLNYGYQQNITLNKTKINLINLELKRRDSSR